MKIRMERVKAAFLLIALIMRDEIQHQLGDL